MSDPEIETIRRRLPELYENRDRGLKPGGLCTPESGCGPKSCGPQADIWTILTGSSATPPAHAERDDQTVESETQSDTSGLSPHTPMDRSHP